MSNDDLARVLRNAGLLSALRKPADSDDDLIARLASKFGMCESEFVCLLLEALTNSDTQDDPTFH